MAAELLHCSCSLPQLQVVHSDRQLQIFAHFTNNVLYSFPFQAIQSTADPWHTQFLDAKLLNVLPKTAERGLEGVVGGLVKVPRFGNLQSVKLKLVVVCGAYYSMQ